MPSKIDTPVMHHTALSVHDFDRALRFYTDFVGFEVEGEMDRRQEPALATVVGLPGACIRWAMLRLGNQRIELFKYYEPVGDTQPRRQCDLGYNHIGFVVPDVDRVHDQAVQAGYVCVSPPQTLRNGATRAFYLAEPEGAVTEFIQFLDPNAPGAPGADHG